MNAIKQLYLNSGLFTEDGYIKVRDGLWIASGPYLEIEGFIVNMPTLEELNEIVYNLEDLIQIQESCGLESLERIRNSYFPWIKSSTTDSEGRVWVIRTGSGEFLLDNPKISYWVIPIRRSP